MSAAETADQPGDAACRFESRRERFVSRYYRVAHPMKTFCDETGANNARRVAAAELQRLAAQAGPNHRERQKIGEQGKNIAQVVLVAHMAQSVINNRRLVGPGQLVGTANADVEIAIFAQRRQHDSPLNQRLEYKPVRFIAEFLDQISL